MEPLLFEADEVIYLDDPNKRFIDLLPLIPTNTVINKTLPGLGATYTEITCFRNSIIVLPNIATIKSKLTKHVECFGVSEGITTNDVVEYLKRKVENKKILTTPESLHKVLKALKAVEPSYLKTYFILLDESHKLTKDVRYRPLIEISLDDFFQFEGKALVSSTPFKPSDPRLQKFKYIKIQPQFTHKKPVELLVNNNIVFALKDTFERYPDQNQCIFFNSINGILDLILKLGIAAQSSVFCSNESSKHLSGQKDSRGIPINSKPYFSISDYRKFNFFTSSLYNGLDLDLPDHPQLIMITAPNDSKTYLDPYTDIIQIIGRFRTNKADEVGYHAEAIHLVPDYHTGNFKTPEQTKSWLEANQNVYNTLLTLMYANINPLEKQAYKEALKRLPFHALMLNDYHLNSTTPKNPLAPLEEDPNLYQISYFKLDNIFDEERLNSYYAKLSNLHEAYEDVGLAHAANLRHYEVYLNLRLGPIDNQPKLNLRKGRRYSKDNIRQIIDQMVELDGISGEYWIYDNAIYNLTEHYPLVRYAFDKLGVDTIRQLDYSITKIRQALIDYDVKDDKNKQPLIDSVYNTFYLKVKLPLPLLKSKLQSIYDHYKIKAVAKASDLKQWYVVKPTRIIKYKTAEDGVSKVRVEQKAYILTEHLYNLHRMLKRD